MRRLTIFATLSALVVWLLIEMSTACAPTAAPVSSVVSNPPRSTDTSVPISTTLPAPASTELCGKYDVGGVQLYLVCLGTGSPTVVLDAGWGGDSSTWLKIMSELRLHTRACAYDRPGLGQSDVQSGQRTSAEIVEQLRSLLNRAGVEGPYILVGHSLGGMNMLLFASRHPHETVGLVLVDSTHPDQVDRWLALLPTSTPDENEALAHLRRGLIWRNNQALPEMMDWPETLAQVRAVKSLGSLPLAVLVAVDPERTKWGDIPSELAASLDRVWLDLHEEYASLSTASSLILAKHSGHCIQNDEPQVVIDAILGLVDKARKQ
jgi:pimeloyl-ACP methyl ester carboxylesterase